jgi:transcriptional regulator with XRE-family HTH domain
VEPAAIVLAVRRRAGLTQAALARQARTSQPVISAYERGHRDPTYETLRRLVEAAGARLRLDVVPAPGSDVRPPADVHEHASRLVDALSLADAIPVQHRAATLRAPRLVSR